MDVKAQEMAVTKLNTEWKKLYCEGCEDFNRSELDSAVINFEKSLDLLRENNATHTNSYIFSLLKLAEAYVRLSDRGKIALVEKEIKQLGNFVRPGSEKYLNYNYCLAVYYSNISQYEKAISVINSVLDAGTSLKLSENWESKLLHRRALCNYCLGNLEDAINDELHIANLDESSSSEYLQALLYFMFKKKDFVGLNKWIQICYEATREPILRKFLFSDNFGRSNYWAKNGLFFTEYIPLYTSREPSDVLSSYCYDASLFSKGVLLAATNRTSDMILNSGDESLVNSYLRFLQLKSKKQRNTDEEFEIDALQSVFQKYQQEHKNLYRNDFRISWTDIQEKLSDNDIAIEFISYFLENGEKEYAALTLKKGYSSPHYIKLCLEKDIASVSLEKQYTIPVLYNLIWKPLEKEFSNVQNIYFSPTGVFFKIGIEYLVNEDEININNIYSMHRLSSTKELVKNRRRSLTQNIALFGGINYNAPLGSSMRQAGKKSVDDKEMPLPIDSINVRELVSDSQIKYLPGTLKEVTGISNILRKNENNNISIYTGNEGDEANFKKLSDKNYSVLHIATHGFFYQSKENYAINNIERNFSDFNLRFSSEDIPVFNEEKMLTRSGLVFAGADNIINKHAFPEGVEDGILYANEISSMNLSTIDLVVLSACQSGLGTISNSEGVFGLQRGFKLAGVHSIIMSLWKVDDEATQFLMTEFYKNVVEGKGYAEALLEAQNALRLIENGKFDSPQYWAAFVLLDGI